MTGGLKMGVCVAVHTRHIFRECPRAFRWVQRAHSTKSPRGLCNAFTSGIKQSEFCTVLVCRG